jgi:hypothetical protein
VLVAGEVPGLENIQDIALSRTTTCALSAGTVKCWGNLSSAAVPRIETIAGVEQATAFSLAPDIFASELAGCASTSRGLTCWQAESTGSGKIATNTRIELPDVPSSFAMNLGTQCGVFAGDQVKCWGNNAGSLLGDGSFGSHPQPVYVPNVKSVARAAADVFHTCWFAGDGRATCRGRDQERNSFDTDGAERAVAALDNALELQLYGAYLCGIFDGVPKCSIARDLGSLAMLPMADVKQAKNVVFVDGGGAVLSGCAGLESGDMACWDQTGISTKAEGIAGVRRLTGYYFNQALSICVLQEGLRCWSWPDSKNGRAKLSTLNPPVAGLELASEVTTVPRGSMCAMTLKGVYCVEGFPRSGPKGLIPGTEKASSLASGYYHACAIFDGSVKCWGEGERGQLGPANFGNSLVPVTVPNTENVVSLVSGPMHTCGVTGDGRLLCWGENASGQISPRVLARSQPFPVRLRW